MFRALRLKGLRIRGLGVGFGVETFIHVSFPATKLCVTVLSQNQPTLMKLSQNPGTRIQNPMCCEP